MFVMLATPTHSYTRTPQQPLHWEIIHRRICVQTTLVDVQEQKCGEYVQGDKQHLAELR